MMKKLFNFALFGAIALTGAVGISSCSSSDEATADVNPTYDPATNTVNTQFVFNIAASSTPITRMTAANTQADNTQLFRGIEKTQLFAYKLGTAKDGKHVATATTADKSYDLGTILAQGQLDPDGSPKSRRVIELSLPVDVNALMFWGKAPKSGEDANNAQGNISFNASNKDISNHAFSLVPRVATGSTEATTMSHYQQIILTLLNAVVNSSYSAAAGACIWPTTPEVGGDGTANTTDINLHWSDFVTVTSGTLSVRTDDPIDTGADMCPLGEILADAFVKLNTVQAGEVRAGSGESIHYLMKDLNSVINKVAAAKATTYDEWVAKQLGIQIQENIRKIVDANGDLQAISTIMSNAGKSYTDVTANLDLFPENVGLPKGALQLSVAINATAPVATWSYLANSGPTNFNYSVNKFTYPAELCYFGNSPVRVTDDTHVTTDYPDGASNWDKDSEWDTNWTKNSHVKSSTRSVAMQENINYGTALLKSYVTFGSGVTKLDDNNAAIQSAKGITTESNKQFDVSSSLFTLKGILIGGQAQTVGWNYIPKATNFDHVIYDKSIVSTAVPTPAVSPTTPDVLQYNYTLVWDNYNSTLGADAQGDVYVALEFVNNTGSDFWGEKNLIRAGATFYIIGKLSPSGATSNTTSESVSAFAWPAKYALPPYAADGSTVQAKRVFIQDYVTTAKFVINQYSLQHAYNTVPDLRSAQISLGLSVDLEWRPGLVFESTLGE